MKTWKRERRRKITPKKHGQVVIIEDDTQLQEVHEGHRLNLPHFRPTFPPPQSVSPTPNSSSGNVNLLVDFYTPTLLFLRQVVFFLFLPYDERLLPIFRDPFFFFFVSVEGLKGHHLPI